MGRDDSQAGKGRRGVALPTSETDERVFLYVPFAEKEEASGLGAKWDKESKRWFVPESKDAAAFGRWRCAPAVPAQDALRIQFLQAMLDGGLVPGDKHPIMDGRWHSVPVRGAKSTRALQGSYKVSIDEVEPNGYVKNHLEGYGKAWFPRGPRLAGAEREAAERAAREQAASRARELAAEREAVAVAVGQRLPTMPDALSHAYLDRKLVAAFGLKVDGVHLVVPMRDAAGRMWNMQRINPDPGIEKMNEKGGQKTGRFHLIGDWSRADTVFFCEGYSTGASTHMGTGYPVVVCFDSGNIKAVLEELSETLGDKKKVIAGDDDALTYERVRTHLQRRAARETEMDLGTIEITREEFARLGEPFSPLSNPDVVVDCKYVRGPAGIDRLQGRVVNKMTGEFAVVNLVNSGREKAIEAAAEHGATAIFPTFVSEEGRPTDFNDLHLRQGLGAVRDQLMGPLGLSVDAIVAETIGVPAEVRVDVAHGRYVGPVLGNTQHHAVQGLGRGAVATHELGRLDRVPEVGASAQVVYDRGRATVLPPRGRPLTPER